MLFRSKNGNFIKEHSSSKRKIDELNNKNPINSNKPIKKLKVYNKCVFCDFHVKEYTNNNLYNYFCKHVCSLCIIKHTHCKKCNKLLLNPYL